MSERMYDPLGIGWIEGHVVALARANGCYGALIGELGRAWAEDFRAKYGPTMADPSPQAVWQRAAEKAEKARDRAVAENKRLRAALYQAHVDLMATGGATSAECCCIYCEDYRSLNPESGT